MSGRPSLEDLQAGQIRSRCMIASLYSELLQATPPSQKIMGAAHDWSLRNIESLVQDFMENIPNEKQPSNPYSVHFLMAGIDSEQLGVIVTGLVAAIEQHSSLSTLIEQHGKGVL